MVGQNRIYAPYLTVYLVISLPKLPYTGLLAGNSPNIRSTYGVYVRFWPTLVMHSEGRINKRRL